MPGLPSGLVLSRSAADGVKVATPPAALVTFHAPVQTYKVRLLLISSVCSAIEPLDTPVRLNTPESVVKVMVQARPSPAGNGVKPIIASLSMLPYRRVPPRLLYHRVSSRSRRHPVPPSWHCRVWPPSR